MNIKTTVISIIAGLLALASIQAATIVGVTIENFSSERGGFSRFAANTIDGDLGTHWQTNDDIAHFIVFDLGAVYSVDSFTIWNYAGVDNSDIQDVTVNYGTTASLGSSLGGYTIPNSGSNPTTIPFSTISARYIELDIATSYSGDNQRLGFTEIEFNAVPEPSTAALLGLVGLALILRRRR